MPKIQENGGEKNIVICLHLSFFLLNFLTLHPTIVRVPAKITMFWKVCQHVQKFTPNNSFPDVPHITNKRYHTFIKREKSEIIEREGVSTKFIFLGFLDNVASCRQEHGKILLKGGGSSQCKENFGIKCERRNVWFHQG